MRPLQFGVTEWDPGRALPGFTLFSPLGGDECLLIGMRGEIRHQWRLPATIANFAYLLKNGNLLATVRTEEGPKGLAADGGRILELDWDGNVVWEHTDHFLHHDFNRCPNGNTVYLAWSAMSEADAKKARGGIPGSEHHGHIYEDVLREVTPEGELVWEWYMHDHFPLDNYELRYNQQRLEFAHANACHVQDDGNILVSWRSLDLIALIDRQTSKVIWEMHDRSFGGQHDPRRLENGNITLFANGSDQPRPEFSRVLEIDPEKKEVVWEYKGTPRGTFFSPRISGAQRIANGNTLICEGDHGRLFEVTIGGEIVWEYVSPYYHDAPLGRTNRIFRARRYTADSEEIMGRLPLVI